MKPGGDSSAFVSVPRVYLISRSALNGGAIQKFLTDEKTEWRRSEGATSAEEIVELGGRLCYMSFGDMQSPRDTNEYIHNLVSMGHDSVLEHATWSFLITGVSRAFSHQLVRHRVGFSFSQLSQQYHDETNAKFLLPEIIRPNSRAAELWIDLVEHSRSAYKAIEKEMDLEFAASNTVIKETRRAVRSAARSVLPNSTETKILVTANARAIRHFLKVRGNILGDVEMRRVSALLLEILKNEAPAIFDDFDLTILADGSPKVSLKED